MKKSLVNKLALFMVFNMMLGLFYGKEVEAKPKYDKIYSFSEGMAVVRVGDEENGKYGYINDKGEMVVKPIYENVNDFVKGGAFVVKDGQGFFLNKKGKVVEKIRLEGDYRHIGQGIYKFLDRKGEKNSLYSADGKFLRTTDAMRVDHYYEGRAVMSTSAWNYGVLDEEGREIAKPKYAFLYGYKNGLCRFVAKVEGEANREGFLDKNGKEIIKANYVELGDYSDGLIAFAKKIKTNAFDDEVKWGYMDKSEKVILPPIYDRAGNFSEGLALVVKGMKPVYINKKGQEVINLWKQGLTSGVMFYDAYRDGGSEIGDTFQDRFTGGNGVEPTGVFHEGLAIVTKGDKFGVINKKGRLVIKPKYDYITRFLDGRAIVLKRKKGEEGFRVGVIDPTGKEIARPIYDSIFKFDAPFFALFKANKGEMKSGVITKNGKFILKPLYEDFYFFFTKSGYPAFVKKNGKWGKFNERNENKTKYIYDDFSYFEGSKVTPVRKGDAWYLINKKGKEVYKVK